MATHLFILIRCDCDEFRLLENVTSESTARQSVEIVGLNQMKSRLVLVHRIQNCLQNQKTFFKFMLL